MTGSTATRADWRQVSISAEPGPAFSVQSGPTPMVDPCSMERWSRESMGGARAGSERASHTLASERRGRDLWAPGAIHGGMNAEWLRRGSWAVRLSGTVY